MTLACRHEFWGVSKMSYHFSTDDLGLRYPELLREVLESGDSVSPRGMPVKEVRPLVLGLADPTKCVVTRPGFNKALMWLEGLQLLAGQFDLELMRKVAPKAVNLMSQQGAYGPRVADQLPYVVEELSSDASSRRAVVYVGRETDLMYAKHYEQPCTMTWQFFLRPHASGRRLEMVVNMRSWDLVWGLSYDVPQFALVQIALARCFGASLGPLTVVAGSGHIYERHFGLSVESVSGVLSFEQTRTRDVYRRDSARDRWMFMVATARRMFRSLQSRVVVCEAAEWSEACNTWRRVLARLS